MQGTAFSKRLQAGLEAFKAGDFEKARAEFRFLSGFTLNQLRLQGEIIRGLAGFRTASLADIRPVDQGLAVLIYLKGVSEIRLGDYKQGRHSLRRAARINGALYDALADLVLLEILEGRLDKAEKALKRLERRVEKCGTDCIYADGLSERLIMVQAAYQQAASGNPGP